MKQYTLILGPHAPVLQFRPEEVYGGVFEPRDLYQDLLRLCEGIMADGAVTPGEAAYLQQWVAKHSQLHKRWPFNDLIARLNVFFADGVSDAGECEELAGILTALIGDPIMQTDPRLPGYRMASPPRLIFNDPPPAVIFQDREFCATGIFSFGKRGAVERAIKERGGKPVKAPRSITHYLLVGSFVAPQWANGNFGTKIEHALNLRDNGHPISIITEQHWRAAF